MKMKRYLFCLILSLLAVWIPPVQSEPGNLRIYFPDIGQGHATLIISPTGKALLVDGGSDGVGSSTIVPLLEELGVASLDFMVATHYDVDHIGGLDEVARAFPPTVAYDSGDLTAATSNFFSQYLRGVGRARKRIRAGTVIDLGGGAVATCIVVNGDLISGGRVGIFGRYDPFDQLRNSSSIGLLIQYGDFDLFVSGDLSGGGNNTTDVESTVAQLVGDVDVLQLNHHGSRTSSNATFLNTLRAEVGIVQAGRDNTFGHPTVEVLDRFINTAPTGGTRPEPAGGNSPANRVPFIFQNEFSPSGGSVSRQGVVARGTILIETDGQVYTVTGGRLPRIPFAVDGAGRGIQMDFPPSVILRPSVVVPRAGEPVTLQAQIFDDSGTVESATLTYTVSGRLETTIEMRRLSTTDFLATIPGQPDGTRVEYRVTARDAASNSSTARGGYFAGTSPIRALRVNDDWGVPRFIGFPARIAGTVTVGSRTFSGVNNDVYVQDLTGGVNIFQSRSQNPQVAPGDRVTVKGRLRLFNGILELDITNPIPTIPFSSPFGITKLQEGEQLTPIVKTLAQIDESVEGMLVQVNDVEIIDGTIPAEGRNGNLNIADLTGELTVRVLRETGIPGMATPAGKFTIIGVVGQFDGFRPMDSGYQILPRSDADFINSQ